MCEVAAGVWPGSDAAGPVTQRVFTVYSRGARYHYSRPKCRREPLSRPLQPMPMARGPFSATDAIVPGRERRVSPPLGRLLASCANLGLCVSIVMWLTLSSLRTCYVACLCQLCKRCACLDWDGHFRLRHLIHRILPPFRCSIFVSLILMCSMYTVFP